MTDSSRRFKLLLQKNLNVKWKQGSGKLILTYLVPCILIAMVGSGLRNALKMESESRCNIPGFANPSAGVIPYLQTSICGALASCQNDEEMEHIPLSNHGDAGTELHISVPFFMKCNKMVPGYNSSSSDDEEEEDSSSSSSQNFDYSQTISLEERCNETIAFFRDYRTSAEYLNLTAETATDDQKAEATMMQMMRDPIWAAIFPALKGKIIYSPGDSPLAQELVQTIADDFYAPLADLHASLSMVAPDDKFYNFTQVTLKSMASPFKFDVSQLVRLVSECAVPASERFVPASDAAAVEAESVILQSKASGNEFLAAVEFDFGSDVVDMPEHVKYTIRQISLSSDDKTTTNLVKPKMLMPKLGLNSTLGMDHSMYSGVCGV